MASAEEDELPGGGAGARSLAPKDIVGASEIGGITTGGRAVTKKSKEKMAP